jgi:two-component system, sensor histidine kinase and response regulator
MKKILLIEDDSIHREEMAEILRFRGFEVHTAENGRIGIEKAVGLTPDLILCDILMPELDGTQVISKVRADNKLFRTKFVFVTSLADRNEIKSGMLLGADGYLTKPFTIKELVAVINTSLGITE